MVTVRLSDEARRGIFVEAGDLEAARVSVAKLTDAACRILYAEIEARLARGDTRMTVPVPPAEFEDPQQAPVPVDPVTDLAAEVELPPTELPSTELPIEQPSAELPFMEAKRRAEVAFERDYLSCLMTISGGSVTGAARLAGVDRTNFRRLLQRSGLRPRATPPTTSTTTTTTNIAPAATYTDRILDILDENGHGLRTCEIAGKIEQALNFAFGILKSLERQGRVVRHGNRYNTLWTLPGAQPVPRIETIPAAVVAVLSGETRPMDGRRLHEEIRRLLRDVGRPPSEASLRRGISRLISVGTLAYQCANEHGAMYVLARGGEAPEMN